MSSENKPFSIEEEDQNRYRDMEISLVSEVEPHTNVPTNLSQFNVDAITALTMGNNGEIIDLSYFDPDANKKPADSNLVSSKKGEDPEKIRSISSRGTESTKLNKRSTFLTSKKNRSDLNGLDVEKTTLIVDFPYQESQKTLILKADTIIPYNENLAEFVESYENFQGLYLTMNGSINNGEVYSTIRFIALNPMESLSRARYFESVDDMHKGAKNYIDTIRSFSIADSSSF
ncbi:hypothetical protein COEREDRAFT_89446 [Coemansia reversa NRRL 1564]|uniref:Uncharacterized protein n=1 Tax=Coemansia reversa (strain ATCC 12441 / NRRL 1564) TaxID=763665 RepID=A0A2G5B3Q5_COERN|nr:hypothetical protein COEREDRAFT_89446 [Coemansia reversa NRRL 1564]|eukprot:PIA13621.1 hypothetical protein COEREDRAFT_89446 [Coemansia reversa NRRL 1564]